MNASMQLDRASVDDADPLPIDCSPEEWAARVDLACAYRAVHQMGWQRSVVYNHLSARVPGTESQFLINPFGLMYEEITASNLLKVDLDGNKLMPSPHPVLMAGFVVHRSIHMSRADAHFVIHTHSPSGMAVAAQAGGLLPISLGAMQLYQKIAYYDVEGVTNSAEESDHIAAALGELNVAILRNHGLLTCGPTIGRTFQLMRRLEEACEVQVLAQAGGTELVIPSDDIVEKTANQATQLVNDSADTADGSVILWAAVRRWMERVDPSFLS